MSPKRLLRLSEAGSVISEFDENTEFRPVIDDDPSQISSPKNVKKVLFCSGQVYYDLIEARGKLKIKVYDYLGYSHCEG